jgi:hypothetical protein
MGPNGRSSSMADGECRRVVWRSQGIGPYDSGLMALSDIVE